MDNLQSAAQVARKVALITVLGFLVVVLSGPVLTMLGVLLPFALVGLLVWVPYRLFLEARQGGMPAVGRTAGQAIRTVVAVPFWAIGRLLALIGFVVRGTFGLIGIILGLTIRVGAGAGIGAILGVIGSLEYHDPQVRVPAGALIGAAVGLLAWALRSRPARPQVIIVRPAPQAPQPAAAV
jgi:hypothetical protein